MASLLASKDEFVTSVSHELRTPLTVIVGMAEELRRSFDDFEVADVKELIGVIAEQSSELANIVQDLLVIGRSDGGGQLVIKPEPIDLDEELGTCVQLYVPAERPGGVVARGPTSGHRRPIPLAPGRSQPCLPTLCDTEVHSLRLQAVAERRSSPAISFGTTASASPPSDVAHIFDPYVRSATGPALPGSMGLGLAVARKLTQLMGGDLVYERRDGLVSI